MLIWDFLFSMGLLYLIPRQIIRKRWTSRYFERFGKSLENLNIKEDEPRVWFHAVSVGEFLTLKTFMLRFAEQYPNHQLILTVTTNKAMDLAVDFQEALPKLQVCYAPFDYSWVVRKYINTIQPAAYISIETEIWPNLFTNLNRFSIPILIINAKMSDRSYKGFKQFFFLFKNIFQKITFLFVQTNKDQERFESLGVMNKNIVKVGNLKFEAVFDRNDFGRKGLGFKETDWILIAASTHHGEEEIFLDVFQELKQDYPQLKLILVPRHVERSSEIINLMKSKALHFDVWSQKSTQKIEPILIVDKIGILKNLYAISNGVFVGKSLTAHGGQNFIEPAASGVPVMTGPHLENFKDIERIFNEYQALKIVNNKQDIVELVKSWIDHQTEYEQQKSNVSKVFIEQQGMIDQILKKMKVILN